MTEAVSPDKVTTSLTHNAILLVENALQNCPNSVMTISELKKALPKQIDHKILMKILEHLENGNKIVIGRKGITWIYNNNKNLRNAIRNGRKL
jgi:hypothetical protein